MSEKPPVASGYNAEQAAHVRATLLYVATLLQDLVDDYTVVGGVVPSLLIDQAALPADIEPHAGTADLDIAIDVAVLTEQRYEAFSGRLRAAGFTPDEADDGALVRQRWRIDGLAKVTIDFLIGPSLDGDKGGRLRNIENDWAAFIIPGLQLAFKNRYLLELDGLTIMGEKASSRIWVCGAGAFVILKALAFENRGAR